MARRGIDLRDVLDLKGLKKKKKKISFAEQ